MIVMLMLVEITPVLVVSLFLPFLLVAILALFTTALVFGLFYHLFSNVCGHLAVPAKCLVTERE